MKIAKPLTLGILHKPYRFQQQDWLSVAALGFFRLGADNERFLQESLQWPLVVPLLPEGQALDDVMQKTRGEALLLGSAHAPTGKKVKEMCVRMCVAGIDKRLRVIGERTASGWRDAPGEAQAFASMPLTWERAWGGKGHAANPPGCGHAGWLRKTQGRLPNIEYPAAGMARRPAGFGPLDVRWTPRKNKFGTYGKRWREQEAPGFASDIDWSVFNIASPDQWLDGHFEGGEAYRLEGMHPDKPVVEGKLPLLRARAFVLDKGNTAQDAREVPLQLDTVWFLPQHELGILVWHGRIAIADSDALDVAAVMAGYEHAQQPRSLAHYREVMGLRLDPQTAALHAFDESQLAAVHSPATLARKQMEQALAESTLLAKQQYQLDEMDAEFWQRSGMTPPPDHQPPRAELPPLGVVSTQAIAEGDFDLAASIAKATAMAKKVAAEGNAKIEALKASIAVPAIDPEAQLAAALERAALPAYDLLPPQETGRDPQLGVLLSGLEAARAAGQFPDAAAYERAREAVLQTPAMKRKARRAAPVPALPDLPLTPANAKLLGAQALRWKESGVCLAGRDLAGVDLRGADLRGMDLREVMLEGANLAGANLANANLQGAALTNAILDEADFSQAVLTEANLSGSHGARTNFSNADLKNAQAMSAVWRHACLDGAKLDGLLGMQIDLGHASLQGVHAHGTVLLQAQADHSNWQRADLDKAIALRASLRYADFSGAALVKTVLIEAQLQDSLWRDAKWNGVQATGKTDFTGAALPGVRAETCGLHGATLAGADLRGSRFLRCDFGQGDLRGALLDDGIFSYSLFLQADLREASARHADFFQALCRKTDFRDAALDGAQFLQAEMTGALHGATAAREAA